jgi:hypothetical protein
MSKRKSSYGKHNLQPGILSCVLLLIISWQERSRELFIFEWISWILYLYKLFSLRYLWIGCLALNGSKKISKKSSVKKGLVRIFNVSILCFRKGWFQKVWQSQRSQKIKLYTISGLFISKCTHANDTYIIFFKPFDHHLLYDSAWPNPLT